MNREHLYRVLFGPVVSEKAYAVADSLNQIVFRVAVDADKTQIKSAVEKLFGVDVQSVRVLNVKGKTIHDGIVVESLHKIKSNSIISGF